MQPNTTDEDFSSLRVGVAAGGSLPVDIVRRFFKTGSDALLWTQTSKQGSRVHKSMSRIAGCRRSVCWKGAAAAIEGLYRRTRAPPFGSATAGRKAVSLSRAGRVWPWANGVLGGNQGATKGIREGGVPAVSP